jgi:deoxyribodipyrimidine photo-lyase
VDLVIRHGDPVAEMIKLARRVGAEAVVVSADVNRYARRREDRLRIECDRHRISLRTCPGLTIVDPGELRPTDGDHFRGPAPLEPPGPEPTWLRD